MRPVVIVGCGGFGREVWAMFELLRHRGAPWHVEGFADDQPTPEACSQVQALGSTLLGSVADLQRRRSPYEAVLAVGSPQTRRRIRQALAGSPVAYPSVVHPDATVGAGVRLGPGTVVAPGARLSTSIDVGEHVHVDQNATVGHDCVLGDFVRLNPQACVSGSVTLGAGALVGANATILQGLEVGADAVVGAGACVVRDVRAGTTVKGVPAR